MQLYDTVVWVYYYNLFLPQLPAQLDTEMTDALVPPKVLSQIFKNNSAFLKGCKNSLDSFTTSEKHIRCLFTYRRSFKELTILAFTSPIDNYSKRQKGVLCKCAEKELEDFILCK